MRKELSNSFAEAWNASSKAVEKIVRFWLTAAIAVFVGGELGLIAVRTWLDNGAKLPTWIFPPRPKLLVKRVKEAQ